VNTEVATTEGGALASRLVSSPLDLPHADFQSALDRRSRNRVALVTWVRNSLVEGVDFGRIHTLSRKPRGNGRPYCDDRACTYDRKPSHYSKECLFKPGAEKICGMLGVTPTFPSLTDYERASLEDRPINRVVLRCMLVDGSGRPVAEGVGAHPVEFGDWNKALKMAEKSAMIDATLRYAGLSEVFTQDIEDMREGAVDATDDAPSNVGERRAESSSARNQSGAPATAPQVNLLRSKLDRAGIPERSLLEHFAIPTLEELPKAQVNAALAWILGCIDPSTTRVERSET
jgi:hypothetical protein